MISNTSDTSTKGVTLISESGVPPRRDRLPPLLRVIAILLSEAPFRQVQELERKIVETRADLPNGVSENVVEDGCRYGRQQADCGRHQSVRDARAYRTQAGAALLGQI